MSGVFSIASHSALQYLPDVVTQEQIGCAHFSAFSGAISFLPTSDQEIIIHVEILSHWGEGYLYKKKHLAILVRGWRPQVWTVIRRLPRRVMPFLCSWLWWDAVA
jgi:hypothetical protein